MPLLLIVLVLSLAAALDAGAATAGSIVTLREALVTVTVAGQPAAAPTRVRLPYRWDWVSGQRDGQALFQLRLDPLMDAGDEPRAIYIPKIGNQFAVRINGALVTSPLDVQGLHVDFAKEPRFIAIPKALLRGDDLLEITIRAQALRRGGLSIVYFGVESDVEREFSAAYRWRINGSLIVVCISSVVGLFALLLWSQQRDPLFMIFGVAELVWAFRVGDVLIDRPPLGWPAWGVAVAFAYALYVGLTARLTMQVLAIERRWFLLAWRAYVLGAVGVSLAAFNQGYLILWTLWLGLMIALAVLCAGVALQAAWCSHRCEQVMVALALWVGVLVGIRDWVYVWLTPDSFGDSSWVRYVSILFCLTMGFIIADRYTRAVRELRALNQTLAERVAERERQLAASFEQTREVLQQAAALAERQRLMRDMHDGLGSRLSGALNVLRNDRRSHIAAMEYISEALEELKLTVDSLQDYGGDLGTILGNLRYRLQDRLRAAGVSLLWRVPALPPFERLTPTCVRSIQNLMLEVITNAIQHGAATEITVTARFDAEANRAWIEIEDNGRGFDLNATRSGHGLALIKQRAQELGGAAIIDADPGGGCRVRAWLPHEISEAPKHPSPLTVTDSG